MNLLDCLAAFQKATQPSHHGSSCLHGRIYVYGNAMQVCWSDDGERFAGLGDGGVVAIWRLDAPRMAASDTAYLGRSDWCHQVCLSTTSCCLAVWQY